MKTLGICIPTYRRPDFLRRCVESAIETAGGRPIRIFISDDSASSANDNVIAQLQLQFDGITIHRNTVNLGIDRNIQQAVSCCTCDFAWLIGEDDVFLPGAVARVHDLLQTTDAPFVFANYAFIGDDTNRFIASALPKDVPTTLTSRDFISEYLWAVGFIGACVVRRRDWERTEAAPYDTTYYTHVGRIAEMIADYSLVPVVPAECVGNRVEGEDVFTWKKDSYGVFFGFVRMCKTVGQRRTAFVMEAAAAADAFERRYRWLSLRLAMRLRSESAFDHSQYHRHLRQSQVSPLKKLAFLVVSVTPPGIFKPLVRAYRLARK